MASPPNVLHNQTFHIRILQGIQDDTSALSAHSASPGTQFGMTVSFLAFILYCYLYL